MVTGNLGARGTPAKVFLPVPYCIASADIDECAQGTVCPGNATCTNMVGSYTCSCPAGEEGEYRHPGGHGPCPHHPLTLVAEGSHGTQTGQRGERGSWLSSVPKPLLSSTEGTRVQPPLVLPCCRFYYSIRKGNFFPCNFSL